MYIDYIGADDEDFKLSNMKVYQVTLPYGKATVWYLTECFHASIGDQLTLYD